MISTHVLDTSLGRPAAGVPVVLAWLGVDGAPGAPGAGQEIARGLTDGDGRVREIIPEGARLGVGHYRLTFETAIYFAELGVEAFYPSIAVVFTVHDVGQHYHVPLLLSAFGYSTYRGS